MTTYSHSPDAFHQVRMYNSSVKSSNFHLQSMEFQCHSAAVCDYQMEMLHHLLSMETKTLPSLMLIEQQPEIKLGMRPLLLDFLMEVITILNLSKSTFPLTVNLIDRYCSTRIVKKQHYQLLGLTSLWISCKNLDSKFKIPTLNDLRKICVDSYHKELFIEMEKHILKSLEWMVNSPTFDSFIDLYLSILINNSSNPNVANLIKKSNHRVKLLATYFGELFQFYPNIYFDYTSSQIALISILVAILTLKIPVNLISLLNYFNDLLKTKEYKSNVTNPAEDFDEILSVSTFQSLFTKAFFKNLIKIIDNPPKSLVIKYFSENGKYTQLMTASVRCATESLATMLEPPVTPRIYSGNSKDALKRNVNIITTMLPLTPISNSTSPRRFDAEQIFSDNESSTSTSTSIATSNAIAAVTGTGHSKRSFDCVAETDISTSKIGQSDSDLKRSKSLSTKPVFFIP
ncbi:G1/S-specific cyclin [Scheffersomyces stipitis CBS 6054]|uniref:G1/S-specific cyclin n=1 Tax=Scheffersomyces stipitis (strain ATCC 58785 / CBS 6054 / NBRC 10063 / NRRL Y-11545) TaxID=322104 RepID=A3LZC4_PICST|nr:G1/S-specific cyclin [Scheffersomyces stipitis CBS 6054]ABN68316.2 G1/S-specific cyclin [Scheffersomyces stipitis CBS 6054]